MMLEEALRTWEKTFIIFNLLIIDHACSYDSRRAFISSFGLVSSTECTNRDRRRDPRNNQTSSSGEAENRRVRNTRSRGRIRSRR